MISRIPILVLAAVTLTACGGPARKAGTPREQSVMPGGYTEQRPLSEPDSALFRRVTENLTGVEYTPESVATQVVAGLNYRFICTARTVTLHPETYRAAITVYRPLPGRGEPEITEIKRL